MGTSAAPAIEVEHLHKTYGKAGRNEPVKETSLRVRCYTRTEEKLFVQYASQQRNQNLPTQ